jgi:peptide/nickel transport system substrate-binding protein
VDRRGGVLGVVLLAACMLAASCGGNSGKTKGVDSASTSATASPQAGGTLTFAEYQTISGLDPLVSLGSGFTGGIEMAAVYDTLVRYDPATKKYVPRIAESVTPNAGFTEWTIKLRPNVKFSDGTKLDADAVMFGLNRHRSRLPDGPTAANCADYVACPRNLQTTAAFMALVKDIQVVDPLTVKVVLSQAWSSFPYALSVESGMIPSPTALKKCDGTQNPNLCQFNLKPVGAGPFMVDSFKPGESITMVRNANYWQGPTYLDGLKFVAFGDAGGDKTYQALSLGSVDGAFLRTPAVVAQAHQAGLQGVSEIDQTGEMLMLNIGATVHCVGGKPSPTCTGRPDGPTALHPNTSNLKVRQAIAAAFDSIGYNNRAYGGNGYPGTALFQKSFPWDPGVPGPKYDPEAAKSLVAQAKAAGWNGTVRLNFPNTPAAQEGGLATQAMLKNVGINVVLDASRDPAGNQAVVVSEDFDAINAGMSLGPDDSAVWTLTANLASTSPANRSGFHSAKVDQALKDLVAARTDADRVAAYRVIAEEVNAQVPFIPRAAFEQFNAFSGKVHGFVGGYRGYVFFDKVWMSHS